MVPSSSSSSSSPLEIGDLGVNAAAHESPTPLPPGLAAVQHFNSSSHLFPNGNNLQKGDGKVMQHSNRAVGARVPRTVYTTAIYITHVPATGASSAAKAHQGPPEGETKHLPLVYFQHVSTPAH